jgi:hypothetical protein
VWFAVLFAGLVAGAQDAPPPQGQGGPGGRGGRAGGGMMMMGGGNAGQITAISGDVITLKTTTGSEVTLKTTADTRVIGKDRQMIAVKDLKVGDYIGAGGPPGGDASQPRFIRVLDEQDIKRLQEFEANLGKTVIAGEVKAINDTKLTIARPDGQTQDIELDEGTSLKRGRDESITLADVKVGDRVMGQGAVKNGVFVPAELHVMTPGMRRERGQGGGQQGPPQGQSPQEPPK